MNVMVHRTVVRLGTPALHFLWDHVVAGRPILPGAAMFETFAAAACCLAEGSGLEVCLTGLAIPAPVPLSTSAAPVVECALNYVTGEMQLANLALTGPGAWSGVQIPYLYTSVKCQLLGCALFGVLDYARGWGE
jgi:hypothetical protein